MVISIYSCTHTGDPALFSVPLLHVFEQAPAKRSLWPRHQYHALAIQRLQMIAWVNTTGNSQANRICLTKTLLYFMDHAYFKHLKRKRNPWSTSPNLYLPQTSPFQWKATSLFHYTGQKPWSHRDSHPSLTWKTEMTKIEWKVQGQLSSEYISADSGGTWAWRKWGSKQERTWAKYLGLKMIQARRDGKNILGKEANNWCSQIQIYLMIMMMTAKTCWTFTINHGMPKHFIS